MNTTPSPAREAVELPPLPEAHGEFMIHDFDAKPGDPIRYRDVFTAEQMRAYALSVSAAKQEEADKMREALRELLEAHTTPFPSLSMFAGSKEAIAGQNAWGARQEAAEIAARAALSPTQGETHDSR